MRIGLDLDGVLVRFSHGAQYLLATRLYGLDKREDLEWDDTEWNCGRPDEDWRWLHKPEQINSVYRHAHLFGGAIEFVAELARLGDVVIITKRPKAATRVTLDWLRFQFDDVDPYPISEVHIVEAGPKSAVQPQCEVYVDDSLENCADLVANSNARVILMDREWNRSNDTDLYHARATSFRQVLNIVRKV